MFLQLWDLRQEQGWTKREQDELDVLETRT